MINYVWLFIFICLLTAGDPEIVHWAVVHRTSQNIAPIGCLQVATHLADAEFQTEKPKNQSGHRTIRHYIGKISTDFIAFAFEIVPPTAPKQRKNQIKHTKLSWRREVRPTLARARRYARAWVIKSSGFGQVAYCISRINQACARRLGRSDSVCVRCARLAWKTHRKVNNLRFCKWEKIINEIEREKTKKEKKNGSAVANSCEANHKSIQFLPISDVSARNDNGETQFDSRKDISIFIWSIIVDVVIASPSSMLTVLSDWFRRQSFLISISFLFSQSFSIFYKSMM